MRVCKKKSHKKKKTLGRGWKKRATKGCYCRESEAIAQKKKKPHETNTSRNNSHTKNLGADGKAGHKGARRFYFLFLF
jgi:hypothetical protein